MLQPLSRDRTHYTYILEPRKNKFSFNPPITLRNKFRGYYAGPKWALKNLRRIIHVPNNKNWDVPEKHHLTGRFFLSRWPLCGDLSGNGWARAVFSALELDKNRSGLARKPTFPLFRTDMSLIIAIFMSTENYKHWFSYLLVSKRHLVCSNFMEQIVKFNTLKSIKFIMDNLFQFCLVWSKNYWKYHKIRYNTTLL